jgi:hypothetical protein
MAAQGTGAVVKNTITENCWRWLILNEIRKLHRIPDSYELSDTSKTLSGETIGQGVIVSLFQKIIEATRTLGQHHTSMSFSVWAVWRNNTNPPNYAP